ncbi:hypothetical protein ElyMa_004110100 [Elysia marginata]|uniref:Uncharacterized protein n=1 Tax=Elysia marginata TaxID=1093978 RepID=A0AAV4GB55_9GAST|nr:hypothetical protein ElyMa_004110100 [Elysia marginata]
MKHSNFIFLPREQVTKQRMIIKHKTVPISGNRNRKKIINNKKLTPMSGKRQKSMYLSRLSLQILRTGDAARAHPGVFDHPSPVIICRQTIRSSHLGLELIQINRRRISSALSLEDLPPDRAMR